MDRYTIAVHEFYRTYRPAQKRYNLRMHSYESLTGDTVIEIWNYHGEEKGKLICNAKEETAVECYERVTEQLKIYDAMRKEKMAWNKSL